MNQPTAYIRTQLSQGRLPTLRDILLHMYANDEGEHVQYVAPLGTLTISGSGSLIAEFDIWNPLGHHVKTTMWHAGHFTMVFDHTFEIRRVEYSPNSRHVDHPYAYRYAPNYAPKMLHSFITGIKEGDSDDGIPF